MIYIEKVCDFNDRKKNFTKDRRNSILFVCGSKISPKNGGKMEFFSPRWNEMCYLSFVKENQCYLSLKNQNSCLKNTIV